MKQGLTEIIMVLDKSGSMDDLRSASISGFNEFVDGQKKLPGEARLTLVLFDTTVQTKINAVNIADVKPMTMDDYIPGGMTALYDAVARTIDETGKRFSDMKEEDKPEHVIFVITTDGQENSSHEFKQKDVFDKITHQRDVYKWEFMFLAANQDAFAAGGSIGISHCLNYTSSASGVKGMNLAFDTYASSIRGGLNSSMAYQCANDAQGAVDPNAAVLNAKSSQ